MTPQRVVLGAWVAMIALATVRGVSSTKSLPPPSSYVGSAVLFSLLYGASSFLGPLAAALAVGADVGAVMAPYVQGRTTGPLNTVASWLDSLAGAPAAPTSTAAPGGTIAA